LDSFNRNPEQWIGQINTKKSPFRDNISCTACDFPAPVLFPPGDIFRTKNAGLAWLLAELRAPRLLHLG